MGLAVLLLPAMQTAAQVEIQFQSASLSSEAQLSASFHSETSFQRTTRTSYAVGQIQTSVEAEADLAGVSETASAGIALVTALDGARPRLDMTATLAAHSALPGVLSPTNLASFVSGNVSLNLTLNVARPSRLTISVNSVQSGGLGGQAAYYLRTPWGNPLAGASTDFSRPGTNLVVTTVGAGSYSFTLDASTSASGRIDIDEAAWFIDQPAGTNLISLQLEFEPLPDESMVLPRFSIRTGSENQLILELTSLTPGRQYQLERSASLAPADWLQWTSFQAASTMESITDTYSQSAGAMFYRLISLP
jgi:hypothetical protein